MAEREGSFAPSALAMVGVWAVAGAAVGALVDTYRQSERDIYRRTTARVRVGPSLSRDHLGAAVSISW